MKDYIKNFIPRLKEYSESLDKKELFVDAPWVIIDENLNQQKYIFKRNGELIMSLNGAVTIGSWELIPTAKSLLIDRVKDKILLNQDFIDSALMILKWDGRTDRNFILANETLIPDLDIETYIRKLYYSKNKILGKRLKDDRILEVHGFDGTINSNKVTIEGEPVKNGKFEFSNSDRIYEIIDSRINRILKLNKYETDHGIIHVEHDPFKSISVGDLVFKDGQPASNGKYNLSWFRSILVINGQVVRA